MKRSVDIEDAVRVILSEHFTAYCWPLPAQFSTPCITVHQTGGQPPVRDWGGNRHIDVFNVVLDSRAENEAGALEYLNNAVAYLEQSSGLRSAELNAAASWGTDPDRPDLALCTATLVVRASLETVEI